ncbi:MAG: FAD-dependent oxidoreductase [Clostridiales bacterium]|nr:FAD-dependent oxidoreductase [Clostridiales bacterium]
MERYDLAIVGSGAGLMVLEAALSRGLRCAIVEKSKFGGTCLTKGCIPSKMLAYPADLIREAGHARRIGLDFSPPEVDWAKISARMWEQIGHSKSIENTLLGTENLTVYKGTGEFTGPNSMKVSYTGGEPSSEFEAERFVVAVGARSFVPEIEGLEESGYVVSETFFGEKFPEKPWESLVIVGGGPIGAEFAHIFSALGTRVSIVQSRERILMNEEEEISEFVRRQFEENGIEVHTNARAVSAAPSGSNKALTIEDKATGRRSTIEAEEIFIAAGVRSAADSLRTEKAGIELDSKGYIRTNDFLETSVPHIWAIGDINGKYQFRHKANYEAEVLVNNMFGNGDRKRAYYNSVPWAVYTHPQVAHVGLTEREIQDSGLKYYVGKNYYSEVVGGIKMGYKKGDFDDGFVKLIVGEDRKILGVHIVGPHAAILLQPFVYLMNTGHICGRATKSGAGLSELRIMCPQLGTIAPINESMVIHPALSELTAWALEKIDWGSD